MLRVGGGMGRSLSIALTRHSEKDVLGGLLSALLMSYDLSSDLFFRVE